MWHFLAVFICFCIHQTVCGLDSEFSVFNTCSRNDRQIFQALCHSNTSPVSTEAASPSQQIRVLGFDEEDVFNRPSLRLITEYLHVGRDPNIVKVVTTFSGEQSISLIRSVIRNELYTDDREKTVCLLLQHKDLLLQLNDFEFVAQFCRLCNNNDVKEAFENYVKRTKSNLIVVKDSHCCIVS